MRTYNIGVVYAIPGGANPTPVPIASVKGCKIGIKQGKEVFRGNQRDIIDVADKGRDYTLDIQSADFRGSALQLVTPGGVKTAGGILLANGETAAIPGTPYQITVAQSATWREDGGVYDLTAAKWLTEVASAPATGQYSYAAGVYTFAAADTLHVVSIVYTSTPATGGENTIISNSVQGQSVPFKLRVYAPYLVNGVVRLTGFDFLSVHFEDLALDFKTESFATHDLKAIASQDMIGTSQQVVKYWSSELG